MKTNYLIITALLMSSPLTSSATITPSLRSQALMYSIFGVIPRPILNRLDYYSSSIETGFNAAIAQGWEFKNSQGTAITSLNSVVSKLAASSPLGKFTAKAPYLAAAAPTPGARVTFTFTFLESYKDRVLYRVVSSGDRRGVMKRIFVLWLTPYPSLANENKDTIKKYFNYYLWRDFVYWE